MVLQRFLAFLRGVLACGDDGWRVEDFLGNFPTLFIGALGPPRSDTWEAMVSISNIDATIPLHCSYVVFYNCCLG